LHAHPAFGVEIVERFADRADHLLAAADDRACDVPRTIMPITNTGTGRSLPPRRRSGSYGISNPGRSLSIRITEPSTNAISPPTAERAVRREETLRPP
jgi:hypothetical protein